MLIETFTITPEQLSEKLDKIEHLLQQAKGILLGSIMTPDDFDLVSFLKKRFSRYDIPVMKTNDFGHNSHMAPFPLGTNIRIDSTEKKIIFLEAGVL